MWAGSAVAVAIMLAAAALTIAIIAAAHPPVPDGVPAYLQQSQRAFTSTLWISPLCATLLAMLMLAGIVRRREITFGMSASAGPVTPRVGLWVWILLMAVVCVFSISSIALAISSIRSTTGSDFTRAQAFAGLALPLSSLSLMFSIFSSNLLAWWRNRNDVNTQVETAVPQHA